jgi:hypothetical protein
MQAGKGPKASCNHILCYALAQFCVSGHTPEFLTCTERLQEWNKPRTRRVEMIPVDQLSSHRLQLLQKDSLLQSPSKYDPQPSSMHSLDNLLLVEHLRTDLMNESNCVF